MQFSTTTKWEFPLTNDIVGVDVVDIIDIIDVVDVVDEGCEIIQKRTCSAKITLWASTCWPSSHARVTSAKLLSSFKFPKAQLCHSYWPTFSSEKYEKPLHNTTFHKEGAERTWLQSLRQRAGRSLRTERSWRTKRAQRARRALSTECLCPQFWNWVSTDLWQSMFTKLWCPKLFCTFTYLCFELLAKQCTLVKRIAPRFFSLLLNCSMDIDAYCQRQFSILICSETANRRQKILKH